MDARWGPTDLQRFYSPAVQDLLYELFGNRVTCKCKWTVLQWCCYFLLLFQCVRHSICLAVWLNLLFSHVIDVWLFGSGDFFGFLPRICIIGLAAVVCLFRFFALCFAGRPRLCFFLVSFVLSIHCVMIFIAHSMQLAKSGINLGQNNSCCCIF